MRILKVSTARDIMVFMTDVTDHVTGKASLTLTITASKNAGSFSSITPTVTDQGNGWYKLELTTTHTNTLGDLALHITGTGADPSDVLMQVCSYLPGENDAAILAAIDTVDNFLDTEITDIKAKTDNLPSDPADQSAVEAAIAGAVTTIQTDLGNLSAQLYTLESISREENLNDFPFAMYDETGNLVSGLSDIVVEISKDGGAFAPIADTVEEISDGWYKFDLSDTETDAKHIAVRATSASAKDATFVLTTEGS